MANKIKILIAEHDKHDLEILEHELVKGGFNYESKIVQTENDFSDALENFVPDIILSDYTFPSFDGPTAFKIREQLAHDTPFIIVSGTVGEETVVELIKNGVTDFVLKDKLFTLPNKINRALKDSERSKQYNHSQELVLKNERRFRALIEKSNDMKTLLNSAGKIIYNSPSVEKTLGYTSEEILQTHVINLIYPEDSKIFLEKQKNILETPGAFFHTELRFLHKNGNWIWCEGTITNLLNDPSINSLVSNFRNISERKETEKKRIFEENNLNALINNTEDLMWSVDRNFNLISSNIPFDQMRKTNFGKVILKGENVLSVSYSPEMHENFKQKYERAFAGEAFSENEHFEFPHEFWTEISYYPIRKGNEIVGTACYSRDITSIKIAESQLRKSEMFKSGVLNSLTSHIAVVDESGNIVAVNNSWKDFALENGEITLQRTGVGSNYFKVCEQSASNGEKFAEDALQGMKDIMNDNATDFYLEYPCHSPSKKRWFGMRITKFDNDEPMIVVSHINITERKLVEENLIQSEAYLAEAQRLAKMGSWNFDLKINKLTWSEELYNVFATDKQTFTETYGSFLHLIDEQDRETALLTSRHTQKTGEPFAIEYNITTVKGEKRVIQEHGYGEKDRSGNIIRLFGTAQDITERKLAEKKIIESAERLKEAQTISHISHWEIDLTTNINTWSDEFYNIFGIKPEDITPSPEAFLSLLHPDDFVFAKNNVEKAFETLKDGSFHARTKEKDGEIRQICTKWKFEFDKNNNPIRLFGILQDITERKLAEAEREKMVSDIIQRSKNLEQFTYIISHNLRAPIANILGISNVLKGNVTDADRTRIQQFLFTAVEKLDDTVKDLNKILQIRSEITESKESIDLPALVQLIKSSIQNLVHKENAQILTDFSLADKLTTIKSYVHSIFYNLISNAIKYKQPDKAPIITIRSYRHNNKTFISFKDNGTGIDLKVHGEKVFGLYKRFHDKIEGKGLGLFMVKTQIEVLGGSVSVKSEPGMGTEFIIEFPNL